MICQLAVSALYVLGLYYLTGRWPVRGRQHPSPEAWTTVSIEGNKLCEKGL